MSDQKEITTEYLNNSSVGVKISILKNNSNKNLKFQVLKILYIKNPELVNIDKLDYKILKCIGLNTKKTQKGIIRETICSELDRAWTTVYDRLRQLLNRKIVNKFKNFNGKRGRPNIMWSLSKEWCSSLFDVDLYSLSMLSEKEAREEKQRKNLAR